MLPRYPQALEQIKSSSLIKVNYSGKSVIASYKQVEQSRRSEGFLTAHTLVFQIKGSKEIHLPTEDISAHPGDIILLKRGTYYLSNLTPDEQEPYQSLVMHIDDNLLRSFLTDDAGIDIPKNILPAPMVMPCDDQVIKVRNTILEYIERPHENTSQLLELKIREVLLLLLSGEYRRHILAYFQHMFCQSSEHMILTIKANLLKPLSLQEYASLCGLSLSTFKREFSRIYNAPPKKWINDEKLKHAHYLLQQSDKNINEISDECGFEQTSYFIKCYKAYYGETPGISRKPKTAVAAMN
ncbi:MAG: AraC family transcriptional regulator [Chitinophaga sp.]|uniref:helix-turn-helix transcriptional regulator n=1 Tax=Chitinophaga sp. TaxID=1869181 RepID=UPI0025C62077|nr:helix-turn-helix transcriptional regulator [Chitinophaga sp.]MBV8252755.1 AraC family transcriptional regulator [Chitinophaga sp.]